MLTAEQARKLAGPTPEEYVQSALTHIEKAAKDGKRKIVLRDEPWARGHYEGSDQFKVCRKLLTELGYKVSMLYEGRQFVDLGTIIEW